MLPTGIYPVIVEKMSTIHAAQSSNTAAAKGIPGDFSQADKIAFGLGIGIGLLARLLPVV